MFNRTGSAAPEDKVKSNIILWHWAEATLVLLLLLNKFVVRAFIPRFSRVLEERFGSYFKHN